MKTPIQTLKTQKSISAWILMLFSLFLSGELYAQAPAGMVLVTGTDFTPLNIDATKTFYGATEISYYGLQPSQIKAIPPLMTSSEDDDFFDKHQYGITDVPSNVNANYLTSTTNGFQFIFSPFTATSNDRDVIKYLASGFIPGSIVTFKVDYCSPTDRLLPANVKNYVGVGTEVGFKVRFESGQNSPGDKDATKVKMGACASFTASGVADANGNFWMSIVAGYDNKPWHTIAISKIEIYGKPKVEIFAAQGAKVCKGEMITLQSKYTYDADYTWKNAAGTIIGTTESILQEVTTLGSIKYSLDLKMRDGSAKIINSEILTITGTECCSAGASRQTVFFDDFGRFDIDNDPTGHTYYLWDYSNILDPVEVKHISTEKYRYELANPPLLHKYESNGPPNDGWYTVAAYLSKQMPGDQSTTHMGYANNIGGVSTNETNFDHSGKLEGAALFINLDPNSNDKLIYKREISNLCGGKDLFFEAWISVCTDGADEPSVGVKLYDKGNPSVSTTFVAQAKKGQSWIPLTATLPLQGTTLIMELTNKSGITGYSSGHDLVIDDIKLMTCSAPAMDIYFDIATLSNSVEICNEPQELFTKYASTFKGFYGNAPKFLFQWTQTPRVMASWKNIEAPGNSDKYNFNDILEFPAIKSLKLKDGDKIHFRVVAASAAIMTAKNNFQGTGNEANLNDPCKNYSVSRPITATVKCPSCEKADITDLKLTALADSMLCPTGRKSTIISVVTATPLQPNIGYAYYDPSNTIISGTTNTAAAGFITLPVDYTKPGVYSLKVWDKDKAIETNCQATYQIEIQAGTPPTYTMKSNQEVCDGTALTDIGVEVTGIGDISFTLNTSAKKGTATAVLDSKVVSQSKHSYTYTPIEADAPGTYQYTVTGLKDKYCDAVEYLTDPISIIINPSPVVEFEDPADICTDALAKDISALVTVDGAAATGVKFSGVSNITAAGIYTPTKVTTATTQVLTAKYENAKGCKSEATANITVQPLPNLAFVLKDHYCSEDVIDLSAAATPAGGTFTVAPAVAISATNTVEAKDMESGTSYTFTYEYADKTTLCSNKITASTYSITVPEVGAVTSFEKSGIKDPTVTGDLSAKLNTVSVPAGKTPVMNWINPDGTIRTEKTEKITVTHDAEVTKTFTYQVYQTLDGCTGATKDVTFSVSPCAAEQPKAAEDYFCSKDAAKTITVSGHRTGDVIGWLPFAAGSDGFKGIDLPNATVIEGETYTLTSSIVGKSEYYVAAYDGINKCWSPASKVTFNVAKEPTASIASQDKIACYNYTDAKAITLTPAHNSAGISATFKLDGTVKPAPEYVPAAYSAAGTLTLTYQVDSLITPALYTGTAKSCSSNIATEIYSVETVLTPTIESKKVPIDTKIQELTMTGDKPANELRWYLDATSASVHTGAKYDPIQGADYSLSPIDVKLPVFGREVSANGCESNTAEGMLTLVKCPHIKPEIVYEKPASLMAWDECEIEVQSSIPSIKIDNSTLAKRNTTTRYVWYDGTTEIFRSNDGQYIPANIAVGKHNLKVSIYDIIIETGTYCETPTTEVNYEIFEMPTPDLTIPKKELCVYDKAISIKGLNDKAEVNSGTFYMTPGSASTTVPMSFNPATAGAGTYTISFEYTNTEGCTAKSAEQTLTVTEVAKPNDIEFMVLDSRLPKTAGIQTYLFNATPDAGLSLQWYTTVPMQGSSTPAATTPSYSYTLAPQFINNPGIADEAEYFVYFSQKDGTSGCVSKNATAKLTVTDCPTPAPTVVNGKACTYFTGREIPELTAVAPSANVWPAGFAIDADAYVYTTDKLVPNASYRPATLESAPKDYTVEFRTYSPLHGCESPATTATLSTFKQNVPRPASAQSQTECFGLASSITFEVEQPAGTVVSWYETPDITSPKIGSAKTLTFSSSDGDRTAYASLKMSLAPYCESVLSDPSVKFVFDELDEVPSPIIEGFTDCGTSMDINPKTGKPGFPGSKPYPIIATSSVENIVWYSDENATQKIAEDIVVWEVLENNTYKPLTPGVPALFYARNYKTAGNKKCWSEISEPAEVLSKPTPKRPSKLNDSNESNNGVTFICQGSNTAAPIYEVNPYSGESVVKWYNSVTYELDVTLGNTPEPISTDTWLDLTPYINASTAGLTTFYATDELDGCISENTIFRFEVAAKPEPKFEREAYYYCEDPAASVNLAVYVAPELEGDLFTYDWTYSSIDGDAAEFVTTDSANIKRWFYTNAGIDEARVTVTNNRTGCADTAVVRLYVAQKITPRFESEVYPGPQEIVFRNQMTIDSVTGTIWDLTTEISEPYMTRYSWTFIYNADQSVRKMVQTDSTRADRVNNLYYVNRGPSDYDSVIVLEKTIISDDLEDTTNIYTSKTANVDGKSVGVRVSEINGKKVKVHGGIPFKYGTSTITLTRDVYTMDGLPYDTRSCRVTSPEAEVFMPITTGLFIPTSFAPGHASPLVSVFKPYGNKITDFKIWVYDNWGNTVFYSDKLTEEGQPLEAWNGCDKAGNPLPADSYYWKVDASFEDGTKWEGNTTENGKKKALGNVFLIR